MNKVLIITHTDLDGVSCGILFRHFISKSKSNNYDVNVIHCGYNTITSQVKNAAEQMRIDPEFTHLFITDISFPQYTGLEEELQEIHEKYSDKTIKLLDHHSTANWLNKYEWAEVKQNDEEGTLHCGTYWTYKYLMERSIWSPYRTWCDKYERQLNKLSKEWNKALKPLSIPYLRQTCSDNIAEYVMMVDLWDVWGWKNYYSYYNPDFDLSNDLNALLHIKGIEEFCLDTMKKLAAPVIPSVYFSNGANYLQRFFTETDAHIIQLNRNKIKRTIQNLSENITTVKYTYAIRNKERLDNVLSWFKDKYGNSKEYQDAKEKFKIGYSITYTAGVIYLHDDISDVCHGVLSEHPELDFIIGIIMPTSMSFRSVKDLEVPLALISRDIGDGDGGGHEKSAGSAVRTGARLQVLKELLNNIKL